ncbi:unnamed protein product, partial [Choristocarpus tenellus]
YSVEGNSYWNRPLFILNAAAHSKAASPYGVDGSNSRWLCTLPAMMVRGGCDEDSTPLSSEGKVEDKSDTAEVGASSDSDPNPFEDDWDLDSSEDLEALMEGIPRKLLEKAFEGANLSDLSDLDFDLELNDLNLEEPLDPHQSSIPGDDLGVPTHVNMGDGEALPGGGKDEMEEEMLGKGKEVNEVAGDTDNEEMIIPGSGGGEDVATLLTGDESMEEEKDIGGEGNFEQHTTEAQPPEAPQTPVFSNVDIGFGVDAAATATATATAGNSKRKKQRNPLGAAAKHAGKGEGGGDTPPAPVSLDNPNPKSNRVLERSEKRLDPEARRTISTPCAPKARIRKGQPESGGGGPGTTTGAGARKDSSRAGAGAEGMDDWLERQRSDPAPQWTPPRKTLAELLAEGSEED